MRELVRGETLADVVARRGAVPPNEVMSYIGQLASALDAAHGRGVVHGHLGPHAVLVDELGTATLADLGRSPGADGPRGRAGAAPELLAGAPTTCSDVHGLGLIAFELLTGAPPPADGAAPGNGATSGSPGAWQLAPEIGAVIGRALAREPDDRYGGAREFAEALAAAVLASDRTEVIGARVPGVAPAIRSAVGPATRWASSRPYLALLSAALVLLAVVLLLSPSTARAAGAASPGPAAGGPAARGPAAGGRTTPNVTGRHVADAGKLLLDAGFGSPVSWQFEDVARGTACSVVRQEPPAGAPYEKGARATLRIVRGDCR